MSLEFALKKIGDVYTYKNFLVFFGGKKADLPTLQAQLSTHSLSGLKQTHSDILHTTQLDKVLEGDAHWTSNSKIIPYIKTADCMPVMIASPKKNIALAIHAGWRGIENHIVQKSLKQLDLLSDPELRLWIGPHIQQEDFEVDEDVARLILKAYRFPLEAIESQVFYFKKSSKYHLNLVELLTFSLEEMGLEKKQIIVSSVSTRQSENHYSYRRQERGVSNYSFIALI